MWLITASLTNRLCCLVDIDLGTPRILRKSRYSHSSLLFLADMRARVLWALGISPDSPLPSWNSQSKLVTQTNVPIEPAHSCPHLSVETDSGQHCEGHQWVQKMVWGATSLVLFVFLSFVHLFIQQDAYWHVPVSICKLKMLSDFLKGHISSPIFLNSTA